MPNARGWRGQTTRLWPSPQEILCLVLGGLGLFVLLSLISWCQAPWPLGGAAPPINWGGPVGHRLASALVREFGGGAFVMVGLLWQAALLQLAHASRPQRLARGFAGGLLLLGAAPLLQLAVGQELAFMGDAGGRLGRFLAMSLLPYCNVGGTLLISALVVALAGLIIVQPWLPLARRGVALLQQRCPTLLTPHLAGLAFRLQRRQRSPWTNSSASPAPEHADLGRLGGAHVSGGAGAVGARPSSALELAKQAKRLEGTLRDFGIDGRIVQVFAGPVVTMYEFEPPSGLKVNRIVNLADDLALGMKAPSVRIVAPVPGKAVVGIEIPNRHREPVLLGDILASAAFQQATSKLVLALGKDILGNPTVTDLAQIPHLLIAGATGSGKSVGLNSMICSILHHAAPDEVKFIMIDPKMLELSVYDGIPHLMAPVVTQPKRAAALLRWGVDEMGRRYRLLAEHAVRGIEGYNQASPTQPLPYLVVVIDELADLMLVARRDVEESLTRLAQMGRAAGIHLLVATQRPSVDVLTGLIKANFPARLSFQVASRTDSRIILDSIGAERLLGRGDLLFLPPGTATLRRIHGAYVSETDIRRLVDALRTQQAPASETSSGSVGSAEDLELDAGADKVAAAVALVARLGEASVALLQRHLHISAQHATWLLDVMQRQGLVGPADGSRPRHVYVAHLQTPTVGRDASERRGRAGTERGHGVSATSR